MPFNNKQKAGLSFGVLGALGAIAGGALTIGGAISVTVATGGMPLIVGGGILLLGGAATAITGFGAAALSGDESQSQPSDSEQPLVNSDDEKDSDEETQDTLSTSSHGDIHKRIFDATKEKLDENEKQNDSAEEEEEEEEEVIVSPRIERANSSSSVRKRKHGPQQDSSAHSPSSSPRRTFGIN